MRLLNIHDMSFATFEGDDTPPPPYAIASHCWIDDETTYLAVAERSDTSSKGYRKIKGFCDFVKWRNKQLRERPAISGESKADIDWIWIDTCCIDKRHSAEVAENITSMYEYYEKAEECYAYLPDVHGRTLNQDSEVELSRSKWFTRGWTLQELLAPSRVIFLSAEWVVLGHKCSGDRPSECQPDLTRADLNIMLARITGIPHSILYKEQNPRNAVPQDVCGWVRPRNTRRIEDLAYCLLGLLGIYLVPNYGERSNAWVRLQEEVSKKLKREFVCQKPHRMDRTASQTLSKVRESTDQTTSTGKSKDERDPKSTNMEQRPDNDAYVADLLQKHRIWVSTQRDVEMGLRQEQEYLRKTRLSDKVTGWEQIDRELARLEREVEQDDVAGPSEKAAEPKQDIEKPYSQSGSYSEQEIGGVGSPRDASDGQGCNDQEPSRSSSATYISTTNKGRTSIATRHERIKSDNKNGIDAEAVPAPRRESNLRLQEETLRSERHKLHLKSEDATLQSFLCHGGVTNCERQFC